MTTDPTIAAMHHLTLDALRVDVRESIGAFALSRMSYDLVREFEPERVTHRLITEILAHCQKPQVYEESASATALVVGFASWWDMFKATYRQRWWMRWRRWSIRYIERTETKTATVRVKATMAAVFPHADYIPARLGPAYPVVWSNWAQREGGDR